GLASRVAGGRGARFRSPTRDPSGRPRAPPVAGDVRLPFSTRSALVSTTALPPALPVLPHTDVVPRSAGYRVRAGGDAHDGSNARYRARDDLGGVVRCRRHGPPQQPPLSDHPAAHAASTRDLGGSSIGAPMWRAQ